jgi:hypothetical protein
MQRAMVDRLIEFTEHNAELIAEQWFKAVSTHERTKAFHCLAKEACIRQAISFCKNIHKLYFAENCFESVANFMDAQGIVENFFARSIPLEEVIYSFILLRRNIWLQADLQALWNPSLMDMYQAVESNNRIILIFDYATYLAVQKYRQMSVNTGKMLAR